MSVKLCPPKLLVISCKDNSLFRSLICFILATRKIHFPLLSLGPFKCYVIQWEV